MSKSNDNDSRLNRPSVPDDRQVRSQASSESEDKAPRSQEQTDEERMDLFRGQLHQSVMPELPKLEGFHVCWLTTQNPRDTILSRIRLGYVLLKASDFPHLELLGLKTGDYAGCLAINEMLAAKLPLRLYNAYMKYNHHDAPMQEEDKLRATYDMIQEAAKARGARVEPEEGNEELGQAPTRRVSFQH